MTEEAMDLVKAKAAIRAEEEARMTKCMNEINAILQKYNCQLTAEPFITNGLILARAMVTTRPEQS